MLHRSVRSLAIAAPLLVLCFACHIKFDPKSAPFTLDSLITYDHASLVKLAGEERLKDSVFTTGGKATNVTWFMKGTKLEAEIVWTDSLQKFVDHVTIRKNAAGESWWKTRDSISIGSSLKKTEAANGKPVFFNGNGTLYSFGDGNLEGRIHDLKLQVTIVPSKKTSNDLYSSEETDRLEGEPSVTELTVNRDALPSPLEVKTMTVKGPNGKESKVPYLVDRTGAGSRSMDLINQQLKNRFDLTTFDPAKVQKFAWNDATFEFEKDQRMIAFRLRGTMAGVEHDDILFYRLTTGESIPLPDFTFASFFRFDAYYAFIDQFWWHEAAAKRNAFTECSGSDPYCPPDDDFSAYQNGKDLVLTLNQKCFSGGKPKCVPGLDVTLALDILTPSLNEFGTRLIVKENYYGSLISRFKSSYANLKDLPSMLFIRYATGEAEGIKLPDARLAILFDKSNDYTGSLKAFQGSDPWPEGFRVPEFLDQSIGDGPGDEPITGSFTYSGFRVTTPGETLVFTWSDQEVEGGILVGSRWLVFNNHSLISVLATNPDAFHESRIGEEEEGD